MTVPANLNRVDYTGTGSAGPFTVPFPFYDASHLTVLQTDAFFNQTLLTGWTATGAGGPSGAVTLAAACPVGSTLTIMRLVPLTQITSIKNQEAFYPEIHEKEFDLLTMADQQLDETLDRTLRLPAGLSGVDMTLPRPDPGHSLVWNAAGDGLENAGAASATLQQDLADSADVAKGDEMIAVKQPFAGAVARTQHDKNAEWVSVMDFGAVGDGVTDDTLALQTAIKYCFDNMVGSLFCDPTHTYLIDPPTNQSSLVFYGKDLIFDGRGCKFIKKVTGGWWGDIFDVIGLKPGNIYPIIGEYTGLPVPAENIVLKNFTVEHATDGNYSTYENNIGIFHAKNIKVENVVSKNAPNANYSCVNNDSKYVTESIYLENCVSTGAKRRGMSVRSYGGAATHIVTLRNCKFLESGGTEPLDAGLVGRAVHIWYIAGDVSKSTLNLTIDNCYFDETAQIAGLGGSQGLNVSNSVIKGALLLSGDYRIESNIKFTDCDFLIEANGVTGYPTEHPIRLIKLKNVNFTNCFFSKEIGTNFPANQATIFISDCFNTVFDGCKNLHVVTSALSVQSEGLFFANNTFKFNSRTSGIQKVISFNGVKTATLIGNMIEDAWVYFNTVTRLNFASNHLFLNFDTTKNYIDLSGTTGAVIVGNTIELSGTANRQKIVAPKSSNLVKDNIIHGDGAALRGELSGVSYPVSGYWSAGDIIWSSTPTASGNIGWVCTTAGGSYSTTRSDATAYAAGVFALWATGTTVWECTTAGTSDGAAPSIAGKVVGDTVVDGTVVWTLRSLTAAVWKTFGAISA
jgi:hypothetical protein